MYKKSPSFFHDGGRYHMDWFLYDFGLHHERVHLDLEQHLQ